MRVLSCLVLLGLVFEVALAVPVTIFPNECKQNAYLFDWDVKRFGPYTVCTGGKVSFRWRGMHGVFQVPSIACPSNFTAQEADTYKYLASVSNGGGYDWEVPEEPGHYWVTSQHNQDCQNGMLAEFYVVDGDEEPFLAASAPGWVLTQMLVITALANLALYV